MDRLTEDDVKDEKAHDEVGRLLTKEKWFQGFMSLAMPASIFAPVFLLMKLAWAGTIPWGLISVLAFVVMGACMALMTYVPKKITAKMLSVCQPGDGRVAVRVYGHSRIWKLGRRSDAEFRKLLLSWPAESWGENGNPAPQALVWQLARVASIAKPSDEDVRVARAAVDALMEIANPAAYEGLADFVRSRPSSAEMEAVRHYAEGIQHEVEERMDLSLAANQTARVVNGELLPAQTSTAEDLSTLLTKYKRFHSRLRFGAPIGAVGLGVAAFAGSLLIPVANPLIGVPIVQIEVIVILLISFVWPILKGITDRQWRMVNELMRKCEPGDERVLKCVSECLGFPGLQSKARNAIRDLVVRWPSESWSRAGDAAAVILVKQLAPVLRMSNPAKPDADQARATVQALAQIASVTAHQTLIDLSRARAVNDLHTELRQLAEALLPEVERRMAAKKEIGKLLHPVEKSDTLLRPHVNSEPANAELLLRAGDE